MSGASPLSGFIGEKWKDAADFFSPNLFEIENLHKNLLDFDCKEDPSIKDLREEYDRCRKALYKAKGNIFNIEHVLKHARIVCRKLYAENMALEKQLKEFQAAKTEAEETLLQASDSLYMSHMALAQDFEINKDYYKRKIKELQEIIREMEKDKG